MTLSGQSARCHRIVGIVFPTLTGKQILECRRQGLTLRVLIAPFTLSAAALYIRLGVVWLAHQQLTIKSAGKKLPLLPLINLNSADCDITKHPSQPSRLCDVRAKRRLQSEAENKDVVMGP